MPRLRSMGRLIAWALLAILALAALLVAAVLWDVHRSLPTLDGQLRLAGLQAPVTIARDARGTAVVKGANRVDVARGLGFVHAQERFFEMDLTRRSAAGELSALFGAVALEHDKKRRAHRLRALLTARLDAMDANEHALLQAYSDGVNAGLAQLAARPWQYLMLRAEPRPWRPVDSLLVIGEMFWMLQGNSVDEGLERAQWRECVGDDVFDWLEPRGGRWDAALDGAPCRHRARPRGGPGSTCARAGQAPATPPASGAASVVARVDAIGILRRRRGARSPRALAWQQQLGRQRHAQRHGRRDAGQRHAPRVGRAGHLVPGAVRDRQRRPGDPRRGRHTAGRAGHRRRLERPRRVGLHQRLRPVVRLDRGAAGTRIRRRSGT